MKTNGNTVAKSGYNHYFPYSGSNFVLPKSCSILQFSYSHPFLKLESATKISSKNAYKKLSEFLAALALKSQIGFVKKDSEAIGGYHCDNKRTTASKDCSGIEIQELADRLSASNSAFQIQSCLTLSSAYALQAAESYMEFFKIIELYVKYLAESGGFSENVSNSILGRNGSQQIFGQAVYDKLSCFMGQDVRNLIQGHVKIRNYLSHGTIKPEIAEYFGDPENNIEKFREQGYSPELSDKLLFEQMIRDIEPLAILIFSRLNNTEAVFTRQPGCWGQPSSKTMHVLCEAGLGTVEHQSGYSHLLNCPHVNE